MSQRSFKVESWFLSSHLDDGLVLLAQNDSQGLWAGYLLSGETCLEEWKSTFNFSVLRAYGGDAIEKWWFAILPTLLYDCFPKLAKPGQAKSKINHFFSFILHTTMKSRMQHVVHTAYWPMQQAIPNTALELGIWKCLMMEATVWVEKKMQRAVVVFGWWMHMTGTYLRHFVASLKTLMRWIKVETFLPLTIS